MSCFLLNLSVCFHRFSSLIALSRGLPHCPNCCRSLKPCCSRQIRCSFTVSRTTGAWIDNPPSKRCKEGIPQVPLQTPEHPHHPPPNALYRATRLMLTAASRSGRDTWPDHQ